jgi:hypothetical protein
VNRPRGGARLVGWLAAFGVAASLAAAPVITVEPPAPATAAPGDTTEITVFVTIADGYHVMANPAGNEFFVPLVVSLADSACVTPLAPDYPAPQAFRLEGTEEDLPTYAGTIAVGVRVIVAPDCAPGTHTVAGSLRYQACDRQRCLFPATIPFEVDLSVTGEGLR